MVDLRYDYTGCSFYILLTINQLYNLTQNIPANTIPRERVLNALKYINTTSVFDHFDLTSKLKVDL